MTFLEKIKKAQDIINEYADKNSVVGCSFGKDSMVLLDMVLKINPNIPVISVLAETEFKETFLFADSIGNTIKNYRAYFFEQQGIGELCCGQSKIEIFKHALRDYDYWFAGVRNNEGITRSNFKYIEKDTITKINPILEFTELDIWRYIALNKIPINPMYQLGYRSLGCSLCSTPEKDESETEREGRWRDTSKACGECGIHTTKLK